MYFEVFFHSNGKTCHYSVLTCLYLATHKPDWWEFTQDPQQLQKPFFYLSVWRGKTVMGKQASVASMLTQHHEQHWGLCRKQDTEEEKTCNNCPMLGGIKETFHWSSVQSSCVRNLFMVCKTFRCTRWLELKPFLLPFGRNSCSNTWLITPDLMQYIDELCIHAVFISVVFKCCKSCLICTLLSVAAAVWTKAWP